MNNAKTHTELTPGHGLPPGGCVVYILSIFALLIMSQNVSAISHVYASQSFDCIIFEGNQTMFVVQGLTIYCTEGLVEKVNLVLPYGKNEINPSHILIQTTALDEVGKNVTQNDDETVVDISLPDKIRRGESLTLALRYHIQDTPGDVGILRSGKRTLTDWVLGRLGKNTVWVFNTPILDLALEELVVRFLSSPKKIAKDYSPVDMFTSMDNATMKKAFVWHLDLSGTSESGEFTVLLGKAGWGVTPFLVIAISLILFLYLILTPKAKSS